MNCPNCGTPVAMGKIFCPNCGSRVQTQNYIICPNCNTPNSITNKCCSECGTPLGYNQQNGLNKSQKALIISLSVVAAVCVIVVLLIILMPSRKSQDNAIAVTPTAVPTESITHPPAPTPVYTPQPTPVPIKQHTPTPEYISYSTYNDYDYMFSCPYPDGFHSMSPLSDFTRLCRASNYDSGEIYICATYNDPVRSIATIVDNFRSSHSHNSVSFDQRGSNYCSVLISDSASYNYCYYNISNGMIRGFEMSFPIDRYDLYMSYINYMQTNLSFF